ncbi:MAG: penicillin-binding transpeptidase domain-containing protein [Acidobacteria bacterium]|nr:penicillin-binding transpeptidase domain-containing protein [Acidobacteriota bacterium]
MKKGRYSSSTIRVLVLLLFVGAASESLFGATSHKKKTHHHHHTTSKSKVTAAKKTTAKAKLTPVVARRTFVPTPLPKQRLKTTKGPVIRGGPWLVPTYADSTLGDNVDGEDLEVRRAAVEALGPYNGSVVAVDPNTGRILTIVNQKLALSSGFQPCSTIKVSVALAALKEKLITDGEKRSINGMSLTYALAHSNNSFFASLGLKLGYDRVSRYARFLGYGEKAGLDIPGEQPGQYPAAPPKNGGVGMLTSFGEEIAQTPLQLAALMSAMANGGTLYYLQYPRSQRDIQSFMPRVKRELEIRDLIPEVKPGMLAAVEQGTARRARQDEPIAGKTGTCTGTTAAHLGWFGSFNDVGRNKVVVVVLLTGGRPSIGPMAAGIAGDVYSRLAKANYFARDTQAVPSLVSSQICCSR